MKKAQRRVPLIQKYMSDAGHVFGETYDKEKYNAISTTPGHNSIPSSPAPTRPIEPFVSSPVTMSQSAREAQTARTAGRSPLPLVLLAPGGGRRGGGGSALCRPVQAALQLGNVLSQVHQQRVA